MPQFYGVDDLSWREVSIGGILSNAVPVPEDGNDVSQSSQLLVDPEHLCAVDILTGVGL